MPMQVNISTQVNSQSIRRERHNGREHFVIPSRTLPFGVVMNGGLYTREQIEANYRTLDGTLAPLGHPTVNGAFVSAFSPEGINVGHVGAWNRNVKLDGNRVYAEKWLDIEVAQRTEPGRKLVERLEGLEKGEGDPIHTSVAAFVERLEPNAAQKQQGIEWVASISRLDHDAILLDVPGAATPDQGVGLMVNADQAQLLAANAGALVGESYREKEQRIQAAAKAKFAAGKDEYVWVADFTESQAILVRNGGAAEMYGYKTEAGKIVFEGAPTPVQRQESWMAIVANSVKQFFNYQARPDPTKEGDMPLTAEEKAELVKNFGEVVANQIKPLAGEVETLKSTINDVQANQKKLADDLTANQRAQDEQKRKAVAEKMGEVVANALSGEALDAAYKQLGNAAPLVPGQVQTNAALTDDVSNLPKE